MLATLIEQPFDNKEWLFEIKWDGFRAIADWQNKELKFYSRNGISFSEKFAVIAGAIKQLKHDVILDGEIVLMNEENQPDFQMLQHYEENKHLPLLYYVFDLLSLDSRNMFDLPLIERKKLLKSILKEQEVIRYCDHVEEKGMDYFRQVSNKNLEGIIAKKADSRYKCGVRTKDWLKIKHHHSREAVIAGYTAPRGNRKHFGALILAEYDKNELKYIGHTGTGFDQASLHELWKQMQPLISTASPFIEKIKVNAPVTWLKPALICQVNFAEETEGGMLRHPVFLGLRTDKELEEVQKANEQPQTILFMQNETSIKKGVKSVIIGKREVSLTNLDKIFWPEENITKGDLISYYEQMAPFILPYLKDRPLSLKRNPNGIKDAGFFHKDAGDAAPAWVKKADIHSGANDKTIHYLICNDTASLVYIANLGCIEINPWNSTTKQLDKPNYMVIDLDPSDKNSFEEVIETALVVKSVLDKAGATCYCKTSGASGLHIFVPTGAKYFYEQVKEFGKLIAGIVQQKLPNITSIERSLSKRGDKIYLDYLQNRKGQTLASAYSVRPKAGATVSAPLEWDEVKPGLHPSKFTLRNMAERLESKGDLFKGALNKGVDLNKCLKSLKAIAK